MSNTEEIRHPLYLQYKPRAVRSHSQHTGHEFSSTGSIGRVNNVTKCRNRSVILNSAVSSKVHVEDISEVSESGSDAFQSTNNSYDQLVPASTSWVSKRDRHMQLINASIYNKESEIRNRALEQTRQRRILERDRREKYKIHKHFQYLANNLQYPASSKAAAIHPTAYEIMIGGLCFHVLEGGSKLSRKPCKQMIAIALTYNDDSPGPADQRRPTPKKAVVGGVSFLRSKHGNLYRSGLVKAKRYVLDLKGLDLAAIFKLNER